MYLNKVTLRADCYPTDRFYPFNVPALRGTSQLVFETPVAFFVGENGSGKSTLLEAIAQKCDISVWDKPRRHPAHNNPYETCLHDFISVTWANGRVSGSFFRAETFHDLADFIDDVALCDPGQIQYYGGHILNTLSHGESILSYFAGRYRIKGLYLLDEPEVALSPTGQIKLLAFLKEFAATGQSQFIIVTHSPILLSCPGAQIWSFDSSCVQPIRYEETSHYQVYTQFFADRGALSNAAVS